MTLRPCIALTALAAVLCGTTLYPALASAAPQGTTATKAPATSGEVRKVDLAKGEVTLKHGRIENLDMPAMTMVFKAAAPALLKGLKVGDKVAFAAEDRAGVLTVTAIDAAR